MRLAGIFCLTFVFALNASKGTEISATPSPPPGTVLAQTKLEGTHGVRLFYKSPRDGIFRREVGQIVTARLSEKPVTLSLKVVDCDEAVSPTIANTSVTLRSLDPDTGTQLYSGEFVLPSDLRPGTFLNFPLPASAFVADGKTLLIIGFSAENEKVWLNLATVTKEEEPFQLYEPDVKGNLASETKRGTLVHVISQP